MTHHFKLDKLDEPLKRRRKRVSRYPTCATMAQWARILGMSRHTMRNLLDSTRLRPRHIGRTRIVYLSDWVKVDRELWESMLLKDTLGFAEEDDDEEVG